MRAAIPLDGVLEKDWQRQVIELARLLGWRVAHFRPAQTKHGWRTAVAADGEGYPDLTLVRERTVWLELKRESGKPTEAQAAWLRDLHAAGAEVYLARPRHLEQLSKILGARGVDRAEARGQLLLELDPILNQEAA